MLREPIQLVCNLDEEALVHEGLSRQVALPAPVAPVRQKAHNYIGKKRSADIARCEV